MSSSLLFLALFGLVLFLDLLLEDFLLVQKQKKTKKEKMMADINHVVLVGRLVRDCELKYTNAASPGHDERAIYKAIISGLAYNGLFGTTF